MTAVDHGGVDAARVSYVELGSRGGAYFFFPFPIALPNRTRTTRGSTGRDVHGRPALRRTAGTLIHNLVWTILPLIRLLGGVVPKSFS